MVDYNGSESLFYLYCKDGKIVDFSAFIHGVDSRTVLMTDAKRMCAFNFPVTSHSK